MAVKYTKKSGKKQYKGYQKPLLITFSKIKKIKTSSFVDPGGEYI